MLGPHIFGSLRRFFHKFRDRQTILAYLWIRKAFEKALDTLLVGFVFGSATCHSFNYEPSDADKRGLGR